MQPNCDFRGLAYSWRGTGFSRLALRPEAERLKWKSGKLYEYPGLVKNYTKRTFI